MLRGKNVGIPTKKWKLILKTENSVSESITENTANKLNSRFQMMQEQNQGTCKINKSIPSDKQKRRKDGKKMKIFCADIKWCSTHVIRDPKRED